MKVEVQNFESIIFLSIVNLCLTVQAFAEKTLNSLNSEMYYSKRHNSSQHQQQQQQHHHHHHHHHHHPHQVTEQPHPIEPIKWSRDNFLLIDYLDDGEIERRISYKGVTAKETKVASNSSKSLSLWQLTNGHGFIQMIYSSDDQLIDCEYVRQKGLIYEFTRKFYSEYDQAKARNFTTPVKHNYDPEFRNYYTDNEIDLRDVDGSEIGDDVFGLRNLQYYQLNNVADIPEDLKSFMAYKTLKEQCDVKQKHLQTILKHMSSDDMQQKQIATEYINRRKRDLSDWLMVPNTKWCGSGHNAGKYRHLGGASKADKCCRRHDHCKYNIRAMSSKWNFFNFRPFTISHCSCDMRRRRDLSDILRLPGTKWCGKGWIAKKYSDMGGFSKADRCCRQHDKSCPFWIMGFETKYGLFNWRVNTLMHCKCDERFRTCLKMADSPDATMVGKLFFNIVQTKCFIIKPERICKKRSYWGGECLKKGIRKRAHLKNNRKF